MKTMFAAAIAIALMAGSALAQSEDWFNQQASAGAPSGGMSEKQAIKEAINYVNKTPLGKEYKRLEKDPDAHNTYYFTKLQREYELAVDAIAEGKMVNANKGNWNKSGDNQTSGSGGVGDKTGHNAQMNDKANW